MSYLRFSLCGMSFLLQMGPIFLLFLLLHYILATVRLCFGHSGFDYSPLNIDIFLSFFFFFCSLLGCTEIVNSVSWATAQISFLFLPIQLGLLDSIQAISLGFSERSWQYLHRQSGFLLWLFLFLDSSSLLATYGCHEFFILVL